MVARVYSIQNSRVSRTTGNFRHRCRAAAAAWPAADSASRPAWHSPHLRCQVTNLVCNHQSFTIDKGFQMQRNTCVKVLEQTVGRLLIRWQISCQTNDARATQTRNYAAKESQALLCLFKLHKRSAKDMKLSCSSDATAAAPEYLILHLLLVHLKKCTSKGRRRRGITWLHVSSDDDVLCDGLFCPILMYDIST
jgi:hypothetical protein